MLDTQSAPPDLRLQPFVACYVHRQSLPDDAGLFEPVVARAGTMLEFMFADPYHIPIYGSQATRPCPRITVIGPITVRRVRLLMHGRMESLVVLFRPLGLFRFFRTPVRYLAEIGTEARSVFGSGLSQLYERLGNAETFWERKEVLDSFLLERLSTEPVLDSNMRTLRLLTSTASPTRVSNVALKAGLSARQLERVSLECAGVTPRMLARVARFERAIRLRTRHSWSWMKVAHEVEYYDQMHMIRDFHDFAGCTPGVVEKEIAPEHLINFFES